MKRNSDDIKIAELLKKEVPNCPENEWFVKKVLNRLPEKRPSFFSRAEIFSFVAAGGRFVTDERKNPLGKEKTCGSRIR